MNINEAPEVLTVKEVAEFLKVDPLTIKHYIRDGKIPAAHLSKRLIRILKKDIMYLFQGEKNESY